MELTDVTPWWLNALTREVPRSVRFGHMQPTVIYTDACGPGHVGAVIFHRGERRAFQTHLPKRLAEEWGIYEFEMTRAFFGVTCAIELERGAPLLLFCDNQGSNGCFIRGNSQAKVGRALFSAIRGAAAASCSSIWAEYVSSILNLGDPPIAQVCTTSRPCNTPHVSGLGGAEGVPPGTGEL